MFGDDWFGYSGDRQALEDLYNAQIAHMQVSGHARRIKTDGFKQPPSVRTKAAPRVADINVAALLQQINS